MPRSKINLFGSSSNPLEEETKDIFESVLRLELLGLKPQDNVAPHIPLLCRLALSHELRPHDNGPLPNLALMLQAFPEADKCREYSSLDWPAVIRPIQRELDSFADGMTGVGYAASYGETLIAEFESVAAPSRMSLLLSELVRIIREANAPDAYSELLSNPGLRTEVCLMFPLAYCRVIRYLKLPPLLHGLSKVDHSYALLRALLCNVPGLLTKATPALVSAAQRAAEEAKDTGKAAGVQGQEREATWWSGALMTIGSLSLVSAYSVRSELVAAAVLPNIVLELTIDRIRDPLVFLLGAVQGFEWLWEYIHTILQDPSSSPAHPVVRLRHEMAAELERQTVCKDEGNAWSMDVDDTEYSKDNLGLLGLLRLYSVMVAHGGMQLTLQEVMGEPSHKPAAAPSHHSGPPHPPAQSWGEAAARGGLLGILSGAMAPAARRSKSYVQQARQLALCVLVLWPRLKAVVPPSAVTASIKAMWAEECAWEGRHSHLILQFTTYLVTREFASVGGWVRTATGLSTNIQGDSLTKLADMVVEGTDLRQISRAVMGVPLLEGTANAKAARAGGVPNMAALHCVHALLRSDKLVLSSSDSEAFSQWLVTQMAAAHTPLDPLLPALVDEAAKRFSGEGSILVSLPISDLRGLLGSVNPDGAPAAGALLAAYYLLSRRSAQMRKRLDDHFVQRRRHLKRLNEGGGGKQGEEDSAEEALVTMMPLRMLLREAERSKGYDALYPSMLELAVAHVPHLFVSTDMLYVLDAEEHVRSGLASTGAGELQSLLCGMTKESVYKSLAGIRSDLTSAVMTLNALSRMQPRRLEEHVHAIVHVLLPRLLFVTDRRARQLTAEVWFKIYSVYPAPIAARTVLALLHKKGLTQASHELLHSHAEAVKATRQSTDERKAVDEDLSALLLTQHSAVLQLLLEICVESLSSNDPESACVVRRLACQYIHQMFLKMGLLVKLIHFQGYDARLIPVLVELVPSMHATIPFLQELLSRPDLSSLAFAIQLSAHVAHKYPMQHTETIAHLALHRMREAALSDSRDILLQTVGLLPMLAATFPRTGLPGGGVGVAEQAVQLLASIRLEEGGGGEEEGKGLDEAVQEAFKGIMDKVLLLQGVAV